MQNSEVFRRGAVVPLDADACSALRRSDVNEATRVRRVQLDDDEHAFNWLCVHGFFEKLNTVSGALLDDFEESEIGAGRVEHALEVVEWFRTNSGAPGDVRCFLLELAETCTEAIRLEMPVFFIL